MPKGHVLTSILEKFQSNDKDYRFMSTSDLLAELQSPDFKITDPTQEQRVCQMVVQQLEDASGDISALAVKCLTLLVQKVPRNLLEDILKLLCSKLTNPAKKDDSSNADAASIGLKAVISELPASQGEFVTPICMAPLLEGLTKQESVKIRQDCLEVMSIVIARFGASVKQPWPLTEILVKELEDARSGLQKKAMQCIPGLAMHMDDAMLAQLVMLVLDKLDSPLPAKVAQIYMQTLGGVSKAVGFRFGRFLARAVPLAIKHCENASEESEELQESSLQALNNVTCYCSQDVRDFMDSIIALALKLISFDPNFADETMADEDEDDGDADDDDAELEEEDYSDDDDMSWKVRRAAACLLTTVFTEYSDKITALYDLCCPKLVARFREREENVKLDVFTAFSALLKQLAAVGAASGSDSHVAILAKDEAQVLQSLRRQLNTKSLKVKCGIFEVLKVLVQAHPSCVQAHIDLLLPPALDVLKDKQSHSALKIEVLSFLHLALQPANAAVFHSRLPELTASLLPALNDRYYKVVSEALGVCEALAVVMQPAPSTPVDAVTQDLAKQVFAAVLERLSANDQDQEVKDGAIRCMTAMVSQLSNVLAAQARSVLEVLADRLNNDVTRLTTVKAFGSISQAPHPVDMNHVLLPVLKEMATYLRKAQRSLRHASLAAITAMLHRYGQQVEPSLLDVLLTEASPLICDSDLLLAAAALKMSSAVFVAHPSAAGTPNARLLLDSAVQLASSPLLQGGAHDALKQFCCALHACKVPGLGYQELMHMFLAAGVPLSRTSQRSLAECVAVMCASAGAAEQRSTLELCIQEVQTSKDEGTQRIMLLLIGEIGRVADLADFPQIESVVTSALQHPREDVKAAASLALGGVATGNLAKYLPFLLTQIQGSAAATPKQQYLLLKSLNEVLRTVGAKGQALTPEQLQQVSGLLMASMEVEEECRNMVSDCLGQLAFIDPLTLIPALHAKLTSPQFNVRCGVVAAVRHVLHDGAHPVDAPLASCLMDFLSMMKDEDHNVRKEAVQLLAALVHCKTVLLMPLLQGVLPMLYAQTVVNKDLITIKDLGPFKHKEDLGLDLRKATFECMEGLLFRHSGRLDATEFIKHIGSGLGDHTDIKLVCHSMLTFLARKSPSSVLVHLDSLLLPLQKTLEIRIKSDAVKQEKDRHEDLLRSCLRAIDAVASIPAVTSHHPAFKTLLDRKVLISNDSVGDMARRYAEVQKERKEADEL